MSFLFLLLLFLPTFSTLKLDPECSSTSDITQICRHLLCDKSFDPVFKGIAEYGDKEPEVVVFFGKLDDLSEDVSYKKKIDVKKIESNPMTGLLDDIKDQSEYKSLIKERNTNFGSLFQTHYQISSMVAEFNKTFILFFKNRKSEHIFYYNENLIGKKTIHEVYPIQANLVQRGLAFHRDSYLKQNFILVMTKESNRVAIRYTELKIRRTKSNGEKEFRFDSRDWYKDRFLYHDFNTKNIILSAVGDFDSDKYESLDNLYGNSTEWNAFSFKNYIYFTPLRCRTDMKVFVFRIPDEFKDRTAKPEAWFKIPYEQYPVRDFLGCFGKVKVQPRYPGKSVMTIPSKLAYYGTIILAIIISILVIFVFIRILRVKKRRRREHHQKIFFFDLGKLNGGKKKKVKKLKNKSKLAFDSSAQDSSKSDNVKPQLSLFDIQSTPSFKKKKDVKKRSKAPTSSWRTSSGF